MRLHLFSADQIGATFLERALPVVAVAIVLVPTLVWALAFSSIYSRNHTWYDASEWLYANAAPGSTISSEAWDDALPIEIPTEGKTRGLYSTNATFRIYADMAPEDKLAHLSDEIRRSDYIVLATARLYGAVRRLPWRYPVEIRYYELLFKGQLGFELAHTSMSYPSVWGMTFVDADADESFSVYDHPKVLIYRKVREVSDSELRSLFAETLKVQPIVSRVGSERPIELPVPEFRKSLMLDVPVDELPDVGDYGWNRVASASTILSVLAWIVVMTLISLAAFPLSTLVFSNFTDRGYLLGKTLGILLIAYMSWLPASLGLWNYTVGAVLLAVLGLVTLSTMAVRRRRRSFYTFIKENTRLVLVCEALFLGAFLVGLVLRLGNPDTWHYVNGGEKPMEFGFLNAILRSATMPPLDPFFSGGYINYYYYGLFVVSTLVKLTGIMPGIAFNLIIPTLFALTVGGAFAVVSTITGRKRWGVVAGLFVAVAGPLSGAVTVRGRGGFGEVAAALQQLADPGTHGSLARLWQGFWRWVGPATLPLRTDWFWDASRSHGLYENTITEFPFWSFLFADLHPHTINIPFTVLAVAFALRLAQGVRDKETARSGPLPPSVTYSLAALVLGSLAVTNSWDFPTFLLLTGGALLIAHLQARELSRLRLLARAMAALAISIVASAVLGLVSLGLYFPFFTHFKAFVKGVGLVTYPTEINYYFGFFGFFLFISGSLAVWRASRVRIAAPAKARLSLSAGDSWRQDELAANAACPVQGIDVESIRLPYRHPGVPTPPKVDGYGIMLYRGAARSASTLTRRLRSVVGGSRRCLARNWLLVASMAIAIATAVAGNLLYPSFNWRQFGTLWVLSELLLLSLVAAVGRRQEGPNTAFAWWLLIVGLFVSLGVEVFYIRDHLGGTWYRMNTIFKFYVHTWVILAMASAWALGELARTRWRIAGFTAAVWQAVLLSMTVGVFAYPVFAVQSRWRDRFPVTPGFGTLDGLAYMETATYSWEGHQLYLASDREAIEWLLDNLRGTPIILQAPYGYYRENGVRIAVNTGFPTVLNPLHENEQRYDELIGPRHQDADAIYRTVDVEEAERLLAKYGVSYVYVGPFERAVYPADGLSKFDQMVAIEVLDLVYDEVDVRIYRVGEQVRTRWGGFLANAEIQVRLPTVEPKPAAELASSALRALEQAAKANPDDPGLQFDLGDRYRRLGRFDDAVRVFRASLERHPEDVAMYHTLGDTYAQMGEMDLALEQYLAATSIAPTSPSAYNKLGLAYSERGRWQEAIAAFQRAVEVDPNFAESYFHLGASLEKIDRKDEAIAAYEQARAVGANSDWESRAEQSLRALGR